MSKILDRTGTGAALTAAQNDSNLSSLSGINEAVTGTTYTVTIDDQNRTLEFSNVSPIAVTMTAIATISAALHTDDFKVTLLNIGAGTVTATRGSTDTFLGGGMTLTLLQGEGVTLQTDSTLGIWNIVPSAGKNLLGITSSVAELNILDGVTATAAELNILDGVTATAAELNILDGVTSTAAELNILDGVTSTAAELNILDGVTATAAEINIIDGDTAATATTIVDADRVVLNDAGVMKQVAVTDVDTYISGTTKTLTNKTLTSPIVNNILDSNSNEVIIAGSVASAVNEITITNAASGNKPTINQTGSDDVGLDIEGVTIVNGVITASGSSTIGAIYGTNTSTWTQAAGVRGIGASTGTQTSGVYGLTSNASGYGVFGRNTADTAGATGILAQTTSSSAFAMYAIQADCSTSSGWDFYASGAGTNYGPFTGGHDGLVDIGFNAEQGDILSDQYIFYKKNVSNTIAVNCLCSESLLPIGVYVNKSEITEECKPAALKDYNGDLSNFLRVSFNALGEGMINVCGLNGDIKNGDLIMPSKIAGKGVKQLDDIVRSKTAAKSREDVSFSYPEEIKQIACIYLCG